MKTVNVTIPAVASLLFFSQSLLAGPAGGVVVSGAASINGGGNLLTISQTSPAAIINWNSFSIGRGETTLFQFNGRAGAHSAVLNEVTSGNPSVISGLLESTVGVGGPIGGTVMILNPSGILFTSSAQVNVGSLTASTLGLANNNEFLNNHTLHLGGNSTAGIQNQGNLNAMENIYLIANTVQNSGNITAGDHVGLAAGTQVTLMQRGSERLTVTAGSAAGASVGLDNTASGRINATVAELAAAGGNIYALAINNGGVVRATTVTHEGGAIYLRGNGGAVVNSGTLDASGSASGAKGGLVEVTGGNINLASGSDINVSGDAGGGTALVGGGSHGADPSVPDSQTTTVQQGATINADAITGGNGGKVVVWSDGTTTFSGQISARGGANGGNGGSAEVSGAQTLDITGHADLTAPNGKTGNLLLDPGSVDILPGADTGSANEYATPGQITDGWVNNQLTTSGVIISTSDAGANGVNPPTLTVDTGAAISWNTASSLSLTGQNSVTINGTITGTGLGGLTLSSPAGNIAINNTVSVGGGISLTAAAGINVASSLTANGATVLNADSGSAGTGALTLGAAVAAGNNPLNISAGSITFNAGGSLNSGTAPTTINATGGNSIGLGATPAAGGLNISDANLGTITSGGLTLTTTGVGTVTVDGISSAKSAGVGTVSINASGVTFANNSSTFAALNVTSSGNIQINENITASSVDFHSGTGGTGNIAFGAGLVSVNADSQIYQAGIGNGTGTTASADLVGNSPVFNNTAGNAAPTSFTFREDAAIGDANIPANTQFFNNTPPTSYTIRSDGGNVTLSTGANVAGSALTLSAPSGTLSINDNLSLASLNASANAIDLNGTGGSETITTTGGDQDYTGAVTLGAATTLNSGTIELAGVTGAGNSLELKNSGLAALNGAISGVSTLKVDGSGTATLNNGTVSTSGDQDYTEALTLGANTVLQSSTLELAGVTGAGNSLELKNSGLAALNGAISGVSALKVDGSGTATLNNGTVSTSGDLDYTEALTLGVDTTLNSGTVELSTVNGAHALTVSGTATLGGAVGGVTPLTSVTLNNAANLNGGSVSTSGAQNYNGTTSLGVSTTLNGTSLGLSGVTGSGNNLTLNNSGTATLGGAVSGVGTLSVSGASQLNGGTVTTAAGQSYGGGMTLGAATTLNGTSLALSGVTGGGNNLTLNNSGMATLNGAVSGTGALTASGTGSLTVDNNISTGSVNDSEGTTTLNGMGGTETITTTGSQTYKNISLGADTRLSATFATWSSVDYNGFSLLFDGVDPAVAGITTGHVLGALQRNEKTPPTKDLEMKPQAQVPLAHIEGVPPASSYPPLPKP